MKRLRALSVILFLVSAAVFTLYQVKQMKEADKLPPLISIEERVKEVSVTDGDEKLLEGVTADDTKDGDVSDSLVVESLSNFLDTNRRLVSYAAFDSDNHVSKSTREIVYTDYVKPQFELEEPLRFPVGTTNFQEYMKVVDCLDGDLSDKIKISPDTSIIVDVAGNYNVKFQAANSAGDVVYLPVTVELYENGTYNQTPQIGLSQYLVYVPQGEKLDPKSYLENVTIGGQEYEMTEGEDNYAKEGIDASKVETWTIGYDRIKIVDPVDYGKPGTYEILYSLTSENGMIGNVRLIVVVEGKEKEADQNAGNEE